MVQENKKAVRIGDKMKHTAKLDVTNKVHWVSPDSYILNGLYYDIDVYGHSTEVNHKGKDCVVSNVFCQEGFCSNCHIFKSERR